MCTMKDRIVFFFTLPFRILYLLFIFKYFYTFRGSFIFLNPWYCTYVFYSILTMSYTDLCDISVIHIRLSLPLLCLSRQEQTVPVCCSFFRVCVFCMAMSSPVLLTRVIFIASISTFPACWAWLEDLSKLTSERRGLFTQTRRRPLNGGDISSILLPILAEIVFVLHNEGVQLHFQLPKAPRWPSRATARWEKM